MSHSSRSCRIAHLSDLHVLASSRGNASVDLRTRFASFGRRLDPGVRSAKVLAAIDAARQRGADHFVFSGDLTELGTEAQFEALAEIFAEARIDPSTVTLVPGNHDSYSAPDGWRKALDGPLSAFRETSASAHGVVVEVGGVTIVPLDVACHQPVGRAAGELTSAGADALERRLRDCLARRSQPVIVLHHSPLPHASRTWQWFDGLRGHERLGELLLRFGEASVLHGHFHYPVEKPFGGDHPRIFGATATVEDELGAPRVRVYEHHDTREHGVVTLLPSSQTARAA